MDNQKAPITSTTLNGITTITICRNEKKNAITRDMYSLLSDAFAQAETDKNVRCVFIKGHAGYFTAGNDLADFLHHPPTDESSPVLRFLKNLTEFSKPIIASANGAAVGIGTTMLLHCDYVVLGPTAILKLPFVELGLCPEAASSLLLPQQIGYLRASEMILACEIISAEKALDWGLANAVAENFDETALAIAEKISQLPLASLVLSKKLLKRSNATAISDRLSVEAGQFVQRLHSPEAKEAFTAFLEKRKPNFQQF